MYDMPWWLSIIFSIIFTIALMTARVGELTLDEEIAGLAADDS